MRSLIQPRRHDYCARVRLFLIHASSSDAANTWLGDRFRRLTTRISRGFVVTRYFYELSALHVAFSCVLEIRIRSRASKSTGTREWFHVCPIPARDRVNDGLAVLEKGPWSLESEREKERDEASPRLCLSLRSTPLYTSTYIRVYIYLHICAHVRDAEREGPRAYICVYITT